MLQISFVFYGHRTRKNSVIELGEGIDQIQKGAELGSFEKHEAGRCTRFILISHDK